MTGFIIKIDKNRAIVLLDSTMQEMEVVPKNLQLCSDTVTSVHDSLKQFQWGDLVQLDAQTVGVIVQTDRAFHVLSMYGNIIKMKPQSITNRQQNNNARVLDSQGNMMRIKDYVEVVDGPYTGQYAEIKYLYKIYAFLYSRTFTDDNGGLCVCKASSLLLCSNNKPTKSTASTIMSPRIASPARPSRLV